MIVVEGIVIDCKSDEKANKFRESGNNDYIKNNYFDALIFYNKSICYASTKEVLSLGYANRSAVYFELKYFDECLKNIEWARENEYPADKLSKLDEREQKCKELKLKGSAKKKEDPYEFFKLSYPANKKIPWIVDCVEVRTTEKYGRGIYATQDLEAGDIVSIEDAVIHFLYGDGFYKYCNNCLKSCMLNLIPCIHTAEMMFCSLDCREDFYGLCDEKEFLIQNDMKLLSKLAFPFGGYKMLDDYIKNAADNDLKKTIFDFYMNNKDDPEYDLSLAICFLSLTSIFNSSMSEDEIYDFVSKKTANHIQGIMNINSIVCCDGNMKDATYEVSRMSLFRCLINHNCVSNVSIIFVDNKEVTIVIKPIKAGEQLVYCYYPNDGPDRESNKKLAMDNFQFKCDCIDCLNNTHTVEPRSMVLRPEKFMSRFDFTEARKILNLGWKMMNFDIDSNARVNDCRSFNLRILNIMSHYATFPCDDQFILE